MKRFTLLLIFLVSISHLYALSGEIVYVEGIVDYRPAGGELDWADIGILLEQGDTVITGVDGYCEIELEGESSIKIAADTVFSFNRGSLKEEEEPQDIFHVAVGQVSYKFGRLSGREPAISTPVSVCGIRGTEFTVVASADGQSLYVVSDGEVAVSAEGQEMSLTPDEGVEVTAMGLGEKFPVLQGKIDYSDWRQDADARALEDPAGTMEELTEIMKGHLQQAEYYQDLYQQYKAEMDQTAEEIKKLRDQGKEEDAQTLVDEQFLPLKQGVLRLILNYRYYAISILSLRQYSVSSLYVQQRSLHWGEDLPQDFQQAFDQFMDIYEKRAVPFYEARDI